MACDGGGCKASGGDHRVVVAGARDVIGGDRPQAPGQVCWIHTDEGQGGGVVVQEGETRGQPVDKGRIADRALGKACLQPEAHDFTDRDPVATGVGLRGEPGALDGTQGLTHHRLAGALAVVVDAAAAVALTVLSTGAPRGGATGGVAAGPIGGAGARHTGVGDVGGVGEGGAGLNGGQHHARVGKAEALATIEPIDLELDPIARRGAGAAGDGVVDHRTGAWRQAAGQGDALQIKVATQVAEGIVEIQVKGIGATRRIAHRDRVGQGIAGLHVAGGAHRLGDGDIGFGDLHRRGAAGGAARVARLGGVLEADPVGVAAGVGDQGVELNGDRVVDGVVAVAVGEGAEIPGDLRATDDWRAGAQR